MEQLTRIENIAPEFEPQALASKLNIAGDAARVGRLEALAREACAVAKPQAAAKLCGVYAENENQLRMGTVVFTSPLLVKNMGSLGRAFPYMATEGGDLASWAATFSERQDQIFTSALREAILNQYRDLLEQRLQKEYGIRQLSRMGPGSLATWPIEQQTELFQALSPLPEQFCVELLPNFMMRPAYSVSGIFFETEKKFYNCQLCPRQDCRSRKAPYQGS